MGAYVKALFAYLARGPEALNGSSSTGNLLTNSTENCNSHGPTGANSSSSSLLQQDTNELLLLVRGPQQQPQQSQQAAAGQSIQAIQVIREQAAAAWKQQQPTTASVGGGAGNNWSTGPDCQQERALMRDYYAQYDMLVGLRIASTLTILFVVFILFVIYKTGCARPPVGGSATNSAAGSTGSPRGQPSAA